VDARELRKDLSVGYKKFLQAIEVELFGGWLHIEKQKKPIA
jgi:hypothetical protein